MYIQHYIASFAAFQSMKETRKPARSLRVRHYCSHTLEMIGEQDNSNHMAANLDCADLTR